MRLPSNFRRPEKATWSTSMFRPMPMASVATRKSTSPDWYSATCALRVRGESAPSTTAAPPRCRRTSSASPYTSSAEKAGEFLGAGVGEIGETWPPDEVRFRHEVLDGPAHGFGTEEHGLFLAARVQQPVGEDMAALRVGAELDLVHRHEGGAQIQRHRLHGADEILRL